MKQYHSNHGRPFYKHDPHEGRTPVDVTRAGEHYETLLMSGEPGQAIAKARSEYERIAASGGRDPGLWRFTARSPERPSVELLVPERQDADSGAVEGDTARERGSSRSTARAEHATGRSSALLDGLRPRYAKHRRAG